MPQNAHGAAKGGVLALTSHLVVEGGPHGIRVNAVSPAMTETPQTSPMLHDPEGPQEQILSRVPLRKWGQPEDVANAILFLASDEASHVSGANIPVDGGAAVVGMSDGIRGRLLLRGEDGYEEARVGRVFNARRPDRHPAGVLEALDADDVVAGVRLARASAAGRSASARAATAGRPGACTTTHS